MKIRSKILIPIYGCMLFSFIVIGISIFFVVYQNNLQNGFDHLETRTELKENEVTNFLSELTEKLSELSESSENRESVKTLSKFQLNKSITSYKQSKELLDDNLSHFQSIYPEIQEILFTDVFGIIVYSMKSPEKIWLFIEEEYGKGFLRRSGQGLFISDIRLKEIDNPDSSFIFASNPIIENRWTIGSLIIELDTNWLDDILANAAGLWETWETYLVGRDGIIKTRRENFSFTKFSTSINSPSFKWCFEDDISLVKDNSYYNIIGEQVIGRYKYIPEIDMCLITEIYLDEVLSTAKNILIMIALAAFFIFLWASRFIHIFIRNITSPLVYLTRKVQEVWRWNKNITLDIHSDDEIWDLTKNFSAMLSELRITDSKIEKKVHEQTKEIKAKQKEAEKLNKELFKFQEALKEASDYIAILDHNFKIVYINTSLEKETGYTLKESIWKHPYDLWRKYEDIKKIKKVWSDVSATQKSTAIEILTNRKDGTRFVSKVHISPILNTAWKIIFYLTIENDITQENQIKQMKDDFISLVSHELRTPMTVIKWFTKIILHEDFGPLNTEQRKYLKRIESNTNYLIWMVNDMLDIDKLNSGKMNFHYKEFNILALIKDLQTELETMCKKKNIRLSVSGKKQTIYSDDEKIKQVLINLIRNAYKFTPEYWSIEIKLSKKKTSFKVEVVDTWIGIKKEDFWKIFQKFQQVDSPLQKKHAGTWLGLNICKLIIEKLWWEINFSSVFEKGSTFYFILPITSKQEK